MPAEGSFVKENWPSKGWRNKGVLISNTYLRTNIERRYLVWVASPSGQRSNTLKRRWIIEISKKFSCFLVPSRKGPSNAMGNHTLSELSLWKKNRWYRSMVSSCSQRYLCTGPPPCSCCIFIHTCDLTFGITYLKTMSNTQFNANLFTSLQRNPISLNAVQCILLT